MSLLIDKVRIKNFRALKDVEISLQPTTILVGTNNSGKTTFLQALNIALGVNKRLLTKDDLFIDKEGKQIEKSIIIDLHIVPIDGSGQRVEDFDTEWETTFGDDRGKEGDYAFFAFRTEITFKQVGYETNVYYLKPWENPNPGEADKLSNNDYKAVCAYFLDAQRDLEHDVKLRTSYFGKLATQIIEDYKDEDSKKIEGLVKDLNETAIDKSITLSHLRKELSKLNQTTQTTGEGVSISPFPLKIRDLYKSMSVNYQDNHSDAFSLEYHGMGTRSWASILSFSAFIDWEIKRKEGKEAYFPILLLEEPEAHLHPNAQRTLYSQLDNIKGQKIISTHSPYIVGQAELEELIFFRKEEDNSILSSIDDIASMKAHQKLAMSRFVVELRGDILFSKLVILVEGETEERCLNIIADKFFAKKTYPLGINITGCGGSNFKYFIKILQAANIPFFIFSDYDNVETRTKVNRQLEECDLNPTTCNELIDLQEDIESYLVNNGYEAEVRQAAQAFIPVWFSRENIREEQNNRIADKAGLIEFTKKYKTKLAPIYAEIICQLDITRCYPPKIKTLFERVQHQLNLTV